MQTTSKGLTLCLSGVIQTVKIGGAGSMSSQSLLTTIVANWINLDSNPAVKGKKNLPKTS
jgi:hypothetical protein